jgi:hypothetical protein
MRRHASIGWPASRPEVDISLLTRILFAAYFLEAGLILVVAPWSSFWDRNLFFYTIPALQQVLLAELSSILTGRRRSGHEPPSIQP